MNELQQLTYYAPILVYHSIFPHGLFAPVQGRKFEISVN